MYVELPLIETSTPAERIAALQAAKELLSDTPAESKPLVFGGGSVSHVYAPDTAQMIRMAEYITTGHDYRDTHPQGKRRPIIKQVTNVTVMAPAEGGAEELEHFLQHVENGDFAEFVRNVRDAVAAEAKEDEDPKQDEDKRPSFE